MTEGVTISVEAELELADLQRGLLFTLSRHSPGLRLLPAFYGFALVAVGGSALLAWRGHSFTPTQILFVVVSLAFVLFVPWSVKKQARALYASLPSRRVHFQFSEAALVIGKEQLTWDRVYQSHETRHAYYLHPRPGAFFVVPKRQLALEQQGALRRLLKSKAAPRRVFDWVGWLSPAAILLLLLAGIALYFAWSHS